MVNLAEIHTGIPEHWRGSRENTPTPITLKRYLGLMTEAYAQVGLQLGDASQCPGIANETGELRIGITQSDTEKELVFSSKSLDGRNMAEGYVTVDTEKDEAVDARHKARTPGHEFHPFSMTSGNWNTLTKVIKRGIEAQAFEPVEKKLFVPGGTGQPPSVRRPDMPLNTISI